MTSQVPLAPSLPGTRAAVDADARRGGKRRRSSLLLTLVLVVCALSVIGPLWVTLTMAFKTGAQAVDGNAFSVEPTLHQSAWFRLPNRDPAVRGLYHVGGGTHPGAGMPGVLLGAEVTAGLVAQDHPRPAGTLGGRRRAAATA